MYRLISILFLLFCIPGLVFGYGFEDRPDPLQPIRSVTRVNYDDNSMFTITIDDSSSTYLLEVPELLTKDVEVGKDETITDPVLYPDFVSASKNSENIVLPSLELCGERGKLFDDSMYATVELTLEKGVSILEEGKIGFLKRLYKVLAEKMANATGTAEKAYRDALIFVTVGLILSDASCDLPAELKIPPDIRDKAYSAEKKFIEGNPKESKPIGFYTLSPELKLIFTRDRWIMRKLDITAAPDLAITLALTDAVNSDSILTAQLNFIINLYSRLTNPPAVLSTKDLLAITPDIPSILADSSAITQLAEKLYDDPQIPFKYFALYPPSRSKEINLAKKLFASEATGDLPGNLMDKLIKSVKDGTVSLAPTADSGWYEYQQYALECLLKIQETPEGNKLEMNEGYIKRLEEAFRSMLTQARETHVKQLDHYITASPPPITVLDVYPNFLLEPLPTYYLRVVQGYSFLSQILSDSLGENTLAALYGFRDKGVAEESLSEELASISELFYGFYLESCMNIGLAPFDQNDSGIDKKTAIEKAEYWLKDWKKDPFMSEDIRVIIPMRYDPDPDKTKCWCVLGVRPITLTVSYNQKPTITVNDPNITLNIKYHSMTYSILVPVFTEVFIPGSEPYTRDEFRALCDKYETKSDIIAALERGEGLSE